MFRNEGNVLTSSTEIFIFGLHLVSCVSRTPRDSLVTSRGCLVCENEGSYVRGHECLIYGECMLFMFEDENRVLGDTV